MSGSSSQRFVIVSHKFLTQPDDDFVEFLVSKKRKRVLHITHSFHDALDRRSYSRLYKSGPLVQETQSMDFLKLKSLEPLLYVKEMFFTLKTVVVTGRSWDTYVGMDGLCVLFGLMLKRLGRAKKIVYWVIDFVPEERFEASWKNKVYLWVNNFGLRNADEVWDLSPRMAEAREKLIGFSRNEYKAYRVVPYGSWTGRIRKYKYEECEKTTLVFMGHLLPKQGVQLVIEAIPEIIKSIPDFTFKIIGEGSYRRELQELAKDLGVEKYCKFLGKIDDHRILETEVAQSCLAVAPYIESLDTWTRYADPGKVKTYLACGVPVLLADIPWNAGEIVEKKCGVIITADTESIKQGVLKLMEKEINQEYRDNAINYSKNFDYERIFSDLEI